MKICLIAEGSYPYITGGVSSWLQMLISSMPEHEFIIYCIGAEEKSRGIYKYEIPGNVTNVKEMFMDNIINSTGVFGKKYNISENQKMNIEKLIIGEDVDFEEIFNLLRTKEIKNVFDFFMSKVFFNVVMDSYKKKYSSIPFTEYFWSIRSMLLPLFYIINNDMPKADLYHSVSTGYAGIVGSLASVIYKKPFILTEHGIYTREREEEIIKSKYLKSYLKDIWIEFFYNLSRFAYYKASEVITLFNINKEIEIELGCSPEKISIIHNGVNVENYKDAITTRVNEETINIGSILRVVPIKDVKTMIEGFAVVAQHVTNCKFYIIGPITEDEEYYGECLDLVESLNVENLIFTGEVNVKEYLKKLDIMVLSSISEGQPLAILEGMACKKPFVTTNVGCCLELILGTNDSYGPAGFVVPVMNSKQLGNAIIKLCKDKSLREQMGQNGFERVLKHYSFNEFIQGYKDKYKEYEGDK